MGPRGATSPPGTIARLGRSSERAMDGGCSALMVTWMLIRLRVGVCSHCSRVRSTCCGGGTGSSRMCRAIWRSPVFRGRRLRRTCDDRRRERRQSFHRRSPPAGQRGPERGGTITAGERGSRTFSRARQTRLGARASRRLAEFVWSIRHPGHRHRGLAPHRDSDRKSRPWRANRRAAAQAASIAPKGGDRVRPTRRSHVQQRGMKGR